MGLLGKIWVKLGLDNSELDKGFKDSEKSAGKFQGALKGIAIGMASAFSVAAVIGFAKKSIQAYNESALALSKLESVLKSTGGAAGLTSEQMQNFAADLQKVTKFEDDATIAAMAVLASFKGISGDVFKGVVTAAMDMSTVIGGDLQSNVYQLAKALERPAEGIQLLNRSTRAFSLAQIEDIKKLVAEGKTHEAQLSILAALEGKFGGAAKAAADTAAGAWVQLGNTIGDIMENIGSATEKSKGFAKSLNSYLTSMKNLWASDEVWTATKVYATFFSWANDNAVKAANAEAERKKKAIEDDAKLTAEKMKGINSVADADKALFDLGLRRYSSEEASFVKALENFKTQAANKKELAELQDGSIAGLKEEIAELEKLKEVATDPKERKSLIDKINLRKSELAAIDGTTNAETRAKEAEEAAKKAREEKIAAIKEEISILKTLYGVQTDEIDRAFTYEAIAAKSLQLEQLQKEGELIANGIIPQKEREIALLKELQNYVSKDQPELIKNLGEQISAREKELSLLKQTNAELLRKKNIELPAVKKPSTIGSYGLTTTGTGVTDSFAKGWRENQAKEGDAAIAKMKEQKDQMVAIAEEMNRAMVYGISDGLQTLVDSLITTGEVDAGSVVAALISPFGDMLIRLGEMAISAGLGIAAIEESFETMNPYVALAAGAAMIALGSAIKAGVASIGKKGASSSSGSASSFSGGNSYAGMAMASIPPIQVEIVGKLSGQDIVLAGDNYKKNRLR